MTEFLAGRTIVVTGGGRGIGRAISLACAAENAAVVVADLGVGLTGADPSALVAQEVVDEIRTGGGTAVAASADVSTVSGAADIIDSAIRLTGRVDGVVAVAGILRESVFLDMTEQAWDDVIATHLKGHFTIFRAAARMMRRQGHGGALVGFTSRAIEGRMGMANYSAAKGGVVSLVRSVAAGLRDDAITCNAIAPVARTRMTPRPDDATEPSPDADPLADPADIAPLAVYLLSEHARHITGQVYSAERSKIAVWNQPREVRSAYTSTRWTVDDIARVLPTSLGTEPMDLDTITSVERQRLAAHRAPTAAPQSLQPRD